MTCSNCGNIIPGKEFTNGNLRPVCIPTQPPEMNSPVYKDSYGDLWHVGCIHRNSDRAIEHYAIFRRSKKSLCDADCTAATNLTSIQQRDSTLVVAALQELAVRTNWKQVH
jgi:hypothetical protein